MGATLCVGVTKYRGIKRAERLGSEEMPTVDLVKISVGNRQLERARGTAGKETEMNHKVNCVSWRGLD